MKTRHILLGAAALLAMAACSKDAPRTQFPVTITASLEESTRVAVTNGGSQAYWEPGDAIKVFYEGTGSKFESTCKSLSTVSDFTGSLNIVGGGNEGVAPGSYIWGLYPYRLDATSDGSSVTTTLPSSQTGRKGSFATGTNITLARSGNFGLAFYNVCGGIRFSLTKEGIKRVTLEGLNGENLAGTAKLTFDGGVPVVQEITEGETSITLRAPEGGSFQTGVWYYIVSLPATLSKGYKLTFRSEEGTASLSTSSSVSIKRGVFGSLANVDASLVFSSGGGDDSGDIKIEIDGEFWDWANVDGNVNSSPGSSSALEEIKGFASDKYIYVYVKRAKLGRWNEIWGGESNVGYYYYDFDMDNNPSTGSHEENSHGSYECWTYLYIFGGSADAPVFRVTPPGSAKGMTISKVICAGTVTDDAVLTEIAFPRSDLAAITANTVTVSVWGNKDAGPFMKTTIKISDGDDPEPEDPDDPDPQDDDDEPTDGIVIDGKMSDWTSVEGVSTPGSVCKEMKVTNDDENFYFYLASEPGPRGSTLWGESAGYYYLDFDLDNDASTGVAEGSREGFEAYTYLYLFGGSADSPYIVESPKGTSSYGVKTSGIVAKGVISADLIEIELSIPFANFDAAPVSGQTIRVLSWRSKDGSVIEQTYTVK